MTTSSLVSLSLDLLMRHALDGVFVVDRQRKYVLFNEGCERITGYRGEDVVGMDSCCGDLVHCKDDHGRLLQGVLCPANAIFSGVLSSARQRMEILHKDGRRVWIETLYSPVRLASGEVDCVLGVMRDASDAKIKEEDLLQGISRLRGELAVAVPAEHNLDAILARIETAAIRRALVTAGGHRHKAAELMGISRSRLYRRMEALGIDPKASA